MTAFDNIASPLTAQKATKTTIRSGVDAGGEAAQDRSTCWDHAPRALSNGQKQRTALARALAGKPRLLLLDDPLRNVDAKLRFEMRLELPRLLTTQGATVIYVTQDYKEAMALGQRIAVNERPRHPADSARRRTSTTRRRRSTSARLFGDPVINLLDVTPERGEAGVMVRLSDRPVAIGQGYARGDRPALRARPAAGDPALRRRRRSGREFRVEVEAETPAQREDGHADPEQSASARSWSRARRARPARPAAAPMFRGRRPEAG